ncbi:hypothetical protein RHMOL_Rhmol02G0180400 [Rhododendron molle]|uniref:Uncharacterized protein n=1 Tax=Rhododendron molle TaxID=49168 RepID=A0ACC0PU73_RHOML|nr:hypothetical protein RHMOL_Rhmol02G0180400 [Rhododendron molle]
MASDPPQTGVDDAAKTAAAVKAAKAAETAKAAKAAKAAAVAEKAAKTAEGAKAAEAAKAAEEANAAGLSKTGGDQITPEAFAQMLEQIKTLTQGLQNAMQKNAALRLQISEPSILNLQHSQHDEENHKEEGGPVRRKAKTERGIASPP